MLFEYVLIRILAFPLQWFPYSWIHAIGRALGTFIYYSCPKYRKRTLSNLALAKDLKLSQKELVRVAKESMQNLAIVCLEYPKLWSDQNLSSIICENPEFAESMIKEGKGVVFFSAHLANWEVLFLEGTRRMPGIAVGKPIKNLRLYRWIVKIREKYGGKIIAQSKCFKEGIQALKAGSFVGIVADQAMPKSNYGPFFLGRRAWTTTAPALLAYRTGCPMIFASTRRVKSGYLIHYSDPIWPNQDLPLEKEIPRMMDTVLTLLQKSILERPGEWLWQHNRWKQQTPKTVYKNYRYDSICLILPQDAAKILPHLPTFRLIYPLDSLFIFAPASCKQLCLDATEIIYYEDIHETLKFDYRFKLIFNFTDFKPIRRHYLRLSAQKVITLDDLKKRAQGDLSEILKRVLTRPGVLYSR